MVCRRQAITWTNAGILLIGPWETNFSEILIGIHTVLFKKMPLQMSSAKWRPFCLGLDVLTAINAHKWHMYMLKLTVASQITSVTYIDFLVIHGNKI